MDAASSAERLFVASRLWAAGISAEYIPQSGVMMNLLKQQREETNSLGDWSLDELCGVCAILKIPFVVIVQPHLLKDKRSVRLRRVVAEFSGSSTLCDEVVALDTLTSTIKDASVSHRDDGIANEQQKDTHSSTTSRDPGSSTSSLAKVGCIYVDSDQYYGADYISKDTSNWKSILKIQKSVRQRSEAFLHGMVDPSEQGASVIAVDLPFFVLRDYGTCLMQRENNSSAVPAGMETTEKYPKHKKILKTLSMAVDSLRRDKNRDTSNKKSSKSMLTFLLYSKSDDRFDMVTLG
mmetsp:Transcript_21174/g.25502  ORF Transcript_21174/g.25502 Transcript_21174/m.25502 type:complete len:293 (-) Transcript_21174:1262-2140(-)